jgi:hypothetical protein
MLRREVMFWGLFLLILLHAVFAHAADDVPDWTFKGFGTLGAVYHDASGVEYRRDISQGTAGAKAGHVSFGQDSMLAVQGDYRGSEALSGTLQVISRLDAENSFAPQVSMAHLKYRNGDALLRAGRLIIETYLEGDAAEVGYANLMVRQPVIFYPRYMDGLDAEVAHPVGDGMVRVKAMGGRSTGKLTSAGGSFDTAGSSLAGIGAEYSSSGWTTRIVSARYTLKKEAAEMQPGGALSSALSMTPNGVQLQELLAMQGRRFNIRMVELAYDREGWQGHAGYATTRSRGWPDQYTAFLNSGYRMGDLTPYASYADQRCARTFVGTGIPDGLSAQTDALNLAVANVQAAQFVNQTDVALGVRYDVRPRMALKLQWDRLRYRDPDRVIDSATMATPAVQRGYKVLNLYSLVLDFMF